MVPFTGRRILIVGASCGIGLALAENLCQQGCHLTLFSRRVAELQTRPAFAAAAGRIRIVPGDITRQADIDRLVEILAHDPPDGVFVVAGVSRPDLIEAIDVDRSIDTLRVNLEGPMRLLYRVLPLLIDRPDTFIVGFTSMAGDRGMPRAHAYSAAKAGLDRFLESLRIDLYDRQTRVITVVPGYVDTPMSQQNRFPMPGTWPVERAVGHILREIGRDRQVIRFPWHHALGMRLLSLLPDRLFWWLMNKQRPQVKIVPRADDRFTWPTDD